MYEKSVDENPMPNHAVMRRAAYVEAGGYDEQIVAGHEDWDFWLNLAEAGLWGYTLPEYLTWYRVQERSRRVETEGDQERERAFRAWLQEKHRRLAERFPQPRWVPSLDLPDERISDEIPVKNALLKPAGMKRVLFIVPWLAVGGAEKLNLEVIEWLSRRGYEPTIVTSMPSDDPWMSLFTSITPDVFCLDRFLNRGDYPRFLKYLIDSRQIDAVVITENMLAYLLVPYLRAHYPNLPILNYNHAEDEEWKDGGYPAMSVRLGSQLDLSLTCTDHLKCWMVTRGADPNRIEVVHYGIDTEQWNPQRYDSLALRQSLGIGADLPLILFVGRLSDEKRPLLFLDIIKELTTRCSGFLALVVGTGPELPGMQAFVANHQLEQQIRLMGALASEQVRELMAASDILLLPSEHEGLALVLYECMAMETVPVAAAVGGHAELVTPECGYLIAQGEGELEAYVEALTGLLRDPLQRRSMAEQARQRVKAYFHRERMGEGMEAAFQRAHHLALARPKAEPDLEFARCLAYLAIEYTRNEQGADTLWAQREPLAPAVPVQPQQTLKRRLLPFGSRRHELYKRVRRSVGALSR